ncbi:MAG: MFS transporter [Candidatus Omnitrophica bacterium]|nr:MFS transporter [Candidatus Omnitrophota bacterium]
MLKMCNKNKVKKSLKSSFLDGIFASCMVGLTTDYITPYALFLKATSRQIGLLNALPNFFSSLIQLKSADLVDKLKSRKKIIAIFVFLHLLMFVPIMMVPFIFKQNPVIFLIIFICFLNGFNAFAGPVWSSLMSEYIPYRSRGRYFGWRNKIFGVIIILCSFLAGFILHLHKENPLKGFLLIFGFALVARFISWCFLLQMYEPAYRVFKDSYFSFFDFIRRIKESNFVKFVLFVSGLNFCVNLASPFFSVFMLKDLRFSYITYTALVISVSIAHIFTINRWGIIADKLGNIKILRFTSFLIAGIPLVWLINQNPFYLIFVQFFSGFAWAGFNLCATNFIYDAVTPPKRTRCIAYFNVFSGIASCLGALLGGHLVGIIPGLFGFRILTLFLISSILRFLVVGSFSYKIKEVRKVKDIPSKEIFFSMIGIRPSFGITQDSRQLIKKEE